MLWAIDVGNTHIVVGLHDGSWRHVWRLDTSHYTTEDALASALHSLCQMSEVPFVADGMIVGSVVPAVDTHIGHFAQKWLKTEAMFLRTGEQIGLKVDYMPPTAVGADRIANALGALERVAPPLVVVDFGTATTFDCVGADGHYKGGSIMPGIEVSAQSLASKTAKLPQVALEAPENAVGKTVTESLQSGLVLGYAGAVDALCRQIKKELGSDTKFLVTGGLGKLFVERCEMLGEYDPYLTLDGLRLAFLKLV